MSAKSVPSFLLWTLTALAQPPQQNLETAELHVIPVQGNVYMMVGPGGNITMQIGKDGVLLVDTMFAPLAPKNRRGDQEAYR